MATTPPNLPPGGGPPAPARNTQDQNAAANASTQTAADLRAAVESLAKAAPAIREMAGTFAKMQDAIKASGKGIEDINKRAKDWSSELRQTLAFTDDIEDKFKAISDFQKKLVREGLKAKDYKQVQEVLEEMEKSSKHLTEKGLMSDEHARVFKRHASEVSRALREVKDKMGTAFDEKHVEATLRPLIDMNKMVTKLSTNLKGLRVSHLGKDLAAAESALGKMLSRNWGRVDKFHKYAQAGHDIKAAQRQRHAERSEHFQARREEIANRVRGMGIDVSKYRTPGAGVRSSAFKKDRERIEAAHYESARAANMSHRAAKVYARNSVAEISGSKPGFATRLGMQAVQAGEGSLGRGFLARGANLLEGGAGSAMRLTAEAAPVLAVLELIKEGFDKNVKMNSVVSDKLGAGNIFGGQNDAITSLRNARRNLNGPIYSRQGIGYEKNLELAKSLVDNGMSVRNLSEGVMGTDQRGYARSSFGTFQKNAYSFGRMAGLDPSQTTGQTIKLISQYGQSLKDTESFFIALNKDSRAAGISASKYIEVLDQINSQYDRSNQLLQTSVDTMRLLSRTGRETADNLKDAADVQTNGGRQQTLEQSAYLGMKTLQDPEMVHRMLAGRQLNFENTASSAASALGDGYDAQRLQAGFKNGGYQYISQLKKEADDRFKGDDAAHQAAINAINNFSTAGTRNSVLQSATQKGGMSGGLALGVADQNLGNDVTSQTMRTLQATLQALQLSGHSTKDLMTPEGRAATMSDTAFLKAQEAMGLDPTKTNKGLSFIDDIAQTKIAMAQTGMTATDKTNLSASEYQSKQQSLGEMYQFLKKSGAAGLKSTGNDVQDLKDFANTKEGMDQMTKLIPQMTSTFEDFYNSPILQKLMRPIISDRDKEAKQDDTAKLVANTRPTAEIFADAFTSLFNMIAAPLNLISRVLAYKFGDAAAATQSTKEQKGMIAQFDNNGKLPAALDTWNQHITNLEAKRDAATSESERSKLDAEIQGAKTRLTGASSALDTYHSGAGIGADQAKGIIDLVQSAAKLSEAPKGLSEVSSKGDKDKFVQGIFSQAGLNFDANTHMAEISDANLKMYQKQLQSIPGVSISTKKDASGTSHTYVTNNYNSVDMNQQGYVVQSAVNDSGETAPNPAATGKK